MNEYEKIVCQLAVSEDVAQALALFLKRLTFDEWLAVTDPSKQHEARLEHAYLMKRGCEAVQYALAKQGFAPR